MVCSAGGGGGCGVCGVEMAALPAGASGVAGLSLPPPPVARITATTAIAATAAPPTAIRTRPCLLPRRRGAAANPPVGSNIGCGPDRPTAGIAIGDESAGACRDDGPSAPSGPESNTTGMPLASEACDECGPDGCIGCVPDGCGPSAATTWFEPVASFGLPFGARPPMPFSVLAALAVGAGAASQPFAVETSDDRSGPEAAGE